MNDDNFNNLQHVVRSEFNVYPLLQAHAPLLHSVFAIAEQPALSVHDPPITADMKGINKSNQRHKR